MNRVIVVSVSLWCAVLAMRAFAEPERWVGTMELPGSELTFAVTLDEGEDGWAGTIDIPAQGLEGGELSGVLREEKLIGFTFEIPNLPEFNWPTWELHLDETGTSATGELKQSGMTFATTMTLDETGEVELMPRPQHPERPLPYPEIEVMIDAGAHTLEGTLTLPDAAEFGDGPYTTALLITGSGPQDRDESLLGHRPFLVLSDHLARNGIAALRCDDRGTGGSTGDFAAATSDDFAEDARACVAFLSERDDVGPVGLIGHSEGGLIAPMVAADSDDVAFVVLLAGPGVPGREVLVRQLRDISAASGMPGHMLDEQQRLQEEIHDIAIAGGADGELRMAVEELVKMQLGARGTAITDDMLGQMVDAGVAQVESPWMLRFMTLDPREALRRVEQPVLALNGSLDLQVLHDQNVPEIEAALTEAGNKDVTARVLDGLNHLFQPATTGGVDEYANIETTFDEDALAVISGWINERFE